MEIIISVLFGFFGGAYIGSYIITILSRKSRGETIRGGYSHCMVCQVRLPERHVIPVYAYIRNRGKCPYCLTPIGVSTILWEVSTGVLAGIGTYFLYTTIGVYSVVVPALIGLAIHGVMQVDRKPRKEKQWK